MRFKEQPPGLRQNERASVRIVLDERDHVLKFERGPQIDEGTNYVYVVRGDRAVRTPVQLGAASVCGDRGAARTRRKTTGSSFRTRAISTTRPTLLISN